jgi:hypothetical protein
MSDAPDIPKAAEERIRAALGAWAQRRAGSPVPDFGRRITLVSVRDLTVTAGFLRCLFDVRAGPTARLIPYHPDAPPKTADKNDPWALTVRMRKQFLEQEETLVAAEAGEPQECTLCSGTTQIEACGKCRGQKTVKCEACSQRGRRSCPLCAGRGSIACAQCRGTGKVALSLAADGKLNEDVCPQCTGNKELECHECADAPAPDCEVCGNKRAVTCPACGGRGAPLCAQCGGYRRVVAGFSYKADYKLAYYRSLVRDPAVPAEIFPLDPPPGKLGPTVLELEGESDADFSGKKPAGAAGTAFERVLSQVPAAGLGPNSRLILRALTIESIPTYDVAYSFEGKEYRAWVGGYGDRVAAQGDPFADLAGSRAAEAESLLKTGDLGRFEDLAAKAAALDPRSPAAAALRKKAGAVQRLAMLRLGAKIAGAAALAVPVVLAFFFPSPNRYGPLAALGLAVLGLSLGAVFSAGSWLSTRPLLPVPLRDKWARGAASAGAVLAVAVFLALAPVRRIDAREFETKLSPYRSLPFESWAPGDDGALAALVGDYSARGVDTSAGQELLDQHVRFLKAAREKAQREEAERLARAEAAKAEQARREAAAKRAKERAAKEAAKKRAAKKSKKPKR